MRLDLEEMEQFPTNKIDGFKERIEAMLPTLIEHRCSEGCRGDFFQSGTRYLDGACN
jgi:cyanophycin synthetase